MAALSNNARQYIGSVEYSNVTAWPSNTAKSAGALIRQNAAPTLGNERVFVALTSGTTTNGTEPTWVVTKGGKTTDNTITWQECTGQPGVNGDTTNSPVWGASLTTTLGQIIYDSVSGSLQIVSTAGTTKSGAQPTFSATAGTTTSDNTTTWTSLGLASSFGAWAAPHKRILNADATNWGIGAGNINFISSTHAETQSSAMTLASGVAIASSPNYYYSVSSAAAPPTSCTAGATVNTTGASNISITGHAYYYGVTFNSGSSTSSSSITFGGTGASTPTYLSFESCGFVLNNTGSSSAFIFGGGLSLEDYLVTMLSPTFTFGATSQKFTLNSSSVVIENGTFAALGSVPTTLLSQGTTTANSPFLIRDSDLSAITGTLYPTFRELV